MNVLRCFGWLMAGTMIGAGIVRAEEQTPGVQWEAKDTKGASIKVPLADQASLLLFVMADQKQSQDAIKQIDVAKDVKGVQVVVIVSGDQAIANARTLAASEQCPWPVVADTDYAASGKLSVRVWPTTVLVAGSGDVLAHLAGVPKSYAKDLESYLAFATKHIDRAELEKRLANHDVVADSPEQIASRHLQVAQRLLDKGLAEQAKVELTEGLKLHPQSPALKLAMAQVMLELGDGNSASKLLEGLDGAAVAPAQLKMLKGEALSQLGKWDEARAMLEDAVKLNPQPAEALYQLGLVYQHMSDTPRAAEAFRKAFEATETGRKMPRAGDGR